MSNHYWLQTEDSKFSNEDPNKKEYLDEIRKDNHVYNVIYNVFYHQDVGYVNDSIRNIYKFNKNNNYLIIAHLSSDLYKHREQLLRLNFLINPVHYNKKIFSWQLTVARFENYQYLKKIGIKFNHMMLTVGTARFIRQAPCFGSWNHNTLNKRPEFGHRVFYHGLPHGCVRTVAIENTRENKFKAEDQDYDNREQLRNTIGIPVWFHMRDKRYKDTFLIPFFKQKGIFISIELLNTWLCSDKMMEEMCNWFYNCGMFDFYKKEDPDVRQKFPTDELLFPTLSRHFDYYYSSHYNNQPHCCFPQRAGLEHKMPNPDRFWNSEHNNVKYIKDVTNDDQWYMYKKIPGVNPFYNNIHRELELKYNVEDEELLKHNKKKHEFERQEKIRIAKYGLLPRQSCKNPQCIFLANISEEYLAKRNKGAAQKFLGLCCQRCRGVGGDHGNSCVENNYISFSHDELEKIKIDPCFNVDSINGKKIKL